MPPKSSPNDRSYWTRCAASAESNFEAILRSTPLHGRFGSRARSRVARRPRDSGELVSLSDDHGASCQSIIAWSAAERSTSRSARSVEAGNRIRGRSNCLGGDGEIRSDPAFPPLEGVRSGFEWQDSTIWSTRGRSFNRRSISCPLSSHGDRIGWTAWRSLAWDLFCGAGLFSLPLAQSTSAEWSALISTRERLQMPTKVAERNGIRNVSFAASDVYPWLRATENAADLRPDLVVVDPPRTGLERRLASLLVEREVRTTDLRLLRSDDPRQRSANLDEWQS